MKTLKQMNDGRFYRNLGYLPNGAQPKFMLGRDASEATIRNAFLERLWAYWRDISAEVDQSPCWDATTLEIAKAIADGRKEVIVDLRSHVLGVEILADLQDVVPQLKLTMKDSEGQKRTERKIRHEAEETIRQAQARIRHAGNQRLHEALASYIDGIKTAYAIPDSKNVSDWGQTQIRQTEFAMKHLPDMRLCDLDSEAIESCLRIIAKRPKSEFNKPIARKFASNVIKQFRHFLKWLNKSKEWQWTKPSDYETIPIRVHKFAEEKTLSALAVKTYTIAQLKTLWQYATPWERALMVLGLNCGFQMAELGTLQRNDVFLFQRHPEAEKLHLKCDEKDSWIRRIRHKSEVYGEWKLWSITVDAIQWLMKHRPQSDSPYLVVNKAGSELKTEGKRNNQIANAWQRLTKRVRKDQKDFPILSFGKLRKTASDLIRAEHGAEIASLFLSHGQPAVADDLIVNYTNPRYATLHTAIEWLSEKLSSIFTVECPFPEHEKKGGANISLQTQQQIIQMLKQKIPPNLIGEKLNLSGETIRRYKKKMEV